MTRPLLRWIAHLMVLVMVAAQLAVAAYACQELQPGGAAIVAGAVIRAEVPPGQTPTSMQFRSNSDCHDEAAVADLDSPNLCAEHCKAGQQSDRLPVVAIALATQGGWYLRPVLAEPSPARRPTASHAHALALTAPPHAIEHCVRRT